MKLIGLLILTFFFNLHFASSQNESFPLHDSTGTRLQTQSDNRFRLTGGLFRIAPDQSNPFYGNFLININYRMSLVNQNDQSTFSHPFGNAEFGLNYFLPYAKLGLEERFYRNVFLDMHVGLQFQRWESSIAPIPFAGFCAGYIFTVYKQFRIEFEAGINIPVFPARTSIQYITIGIAFK